MESKVFYSLSDSYLFGIGVASKYFPQGRDEIAVDERKDEYDQADDDDQECVIDNVNLLNSFSPNSACDERNHFQLPVDLSNLIELDLKLLRDSSRELSFIHEIRQEIQDYQLQQLEQVEQERISQGSRNCANDSPLRLSQLREEGEGDCNQHDTRGQSKESYTASFRQGVNSRVTQLLKRLPLSKREEINKLFKWSQPNLRRTLSAGVAERARRSINGDCPHDPGSDIPELVIDDRDDDVFFSSTETLKSFQTRVSQSLRETEVLGIVDTFTAGFQSIKNGGVFQNLSDKCGKLPKFFTRTTTSGPNFGYSSVKQVNQNQGRFSDPEQDVGKQTATDSFKSHGVELPPVELLTGVPELKICYNSQKRKSKDTDSGMEDDAASERSASTGEVVDNVLEETLMGRGSQERGMTGDADSSNSSTYYSTAEEDYLDQEQEPEPDVEKVVTSSYGTPTTSMSASKFSLLSGFSSGSGTGHDTPTSRPSSRARGDVSFSGSSFNIRPDSDSDNVDKDDLVPGTVRRRSARRRRSSRKSLKRQNSETEKTKEMNLSIESSSPTPNSPEKSMESSKNSSMDKGPGILPEHFLTEGGVVGVKDVQMIFNCFKDDDISKNDCAILLESLTAAQAREDFQRALHQMGGFNALAFLFARVVEICPDDDIQSKSLSLVMNQLRNHSRLTDGPPYKQYHLLRLVLSSEKCVYGFKTFINVLSYCLTPSGSKLLDYQLLDTCILALYKNMIRIRCTPSDAPTGPKTLFECFLVVALDLVEEKNPHRDFNVALLKANRFAESLLAICNHLVVDTSHGLTLLDGVRLSTLIKSILAELMAPPDGYVGVSLVHYGLGPLLPRELPPLPRKEDAYFVFQDCGKSSAAFFHNLRNIREGEEADEADTISNAGNSEPESDQYLNKLAAEMESSTQKTETTEPVTPIQETNVDVPEIIGVHNSKRSQDTVLHAETPEEGFGEVFQEALTEGVMSILLNALSILPDGAFDSVLRQSLNPYIFVAYCSHPSVRIKKLALKLLSAYLTRVKNQVLVEFLKSKGFFLASLYIQSNPEVSQLVLNICNGFGPLSYPLIVSLLYSNTIVNGVLEWVKADEGTIPALLSMGLLPSIFNIHASSISSIQKPLQNLLVLATRYCALHPKEDPWKVLFCPALESGYGNCALVPNIIQDATEFLRKNKKKDLKKTDSNNRLMWLIERGCAAKMGHTFDKWLLSIFTLHIMELDEEEETEYWIHFVKKNRKKLSYLMGIFLCRVFSANASNLDLKHYFARILVSFCPNIAKWLPKVVKCDEKVERCLTAFIRIFLTTADQKNRDGHGHIRSPSFHSLITDNNSLTLQSGDTYDRRSSNPDSMLKNWNRNEQPNSIPAPVSEDDDCCNFQLSDAAIRNRFETVLVTAGVLSPTNSFSTFTPDFKNFKVLVDSHASGVSAIELRQCISQVEKLRAPYLLTFSQNKAPGDMNQGTKIGPPGKQCVANAAYFEDVFEAVHTYAVEMLMSVARSRTQQEIQVARKISVQDEDVMTVRSWMNLREQLVHPKAPWHFPHAYPSFTTLDQSEGPGRMRMRLKREFLKVHNRFVQPKYRKTGPSSQPLDYLFESHTAEILKHPVILSEIQYMRFCTRIIPGEELPGEIILTADSLTFISENASLQSENVEVKKSGIAFLMKCRYTLEDRAVELFLECRSFLFVFKSTKDRDEFVSMLALKPVTNNNNVQFYSVSSSLMDTNITNMTSRWLKGQISNFEYLMYLNTAAGRTYCDLMQYPVFPFVLSKYDSPTLDLLAPQSYRDLRKPMAIQDPAKEDHFVSTYNYLKRECDSAPFHYGSHYSNSGIVLHFLVRLPPYTQHFLTYQDGSFDIPDRSFHSIDTTWRLASRESNTDFKEAIPEFYYLPEFLQNIQHFDLGVRQNGLRVNDVILPPWAKGSARLFTLINRQALESSYVRRCLCHWIDLIFGYKQTGKAALQAINVFHPSTYEGFEIETTGDELLMRARKAMVSTYGQTPKQLFPNYRHPRAPTVKEEKCDMEVLDTVWGIRWGQFIGSPACPDLEVVNTREYSEEMELFETSSRIVFWPEKTLILGDNVVGSWDASSIRVKTKIIFNAIEDDITICVGTTNSIWVGHQSGRISVLKLSEKLDEVLERTELIGHYQPIKSITVNQEFSMAISCAGENYAIVWDINKYPKIAYNNYIQCESAVDYAYSSRSTGDVVLLNKETGTVTLTTINGFLIGTIQSENHQVESVCLSSLDPGRNVNVVAVGCNNGNIRFYSTWDLKFVNQLKVVPLTAVPVMSVRYSQDGRRLYCMSQTEEGAITVALQLPTDKKYF